MSIGVKIKNNVPFDVAYRKFKKLCEKASIVSILKRKEYYEPPSEQKKRRLAAIKKKIRKKMIAKLKKAQKFMRL